MRDLRGKHPPKNLQGVLWSCAVEKLDLWEDRAYIINQVLALGVLGELRWLFKIYPKEVIVDTFVAHPVKEYTRPAFNFAKNILLELQEADLPLDRYVRDLPRHIE